jgi:Zn-dependent alcohol dehydrogenase
MPAIWFRYELSPIRIQYNVTLMPFTTFFVRVCAIIGGIYSVSSILESMIRNSISIFGIGDIGNEINEGANKSTMKRKQVKKPDQQPYQHAPTEESGTSNLDSIELSDMSSQQ